jgi:hypothetical protein
MGQNPSSKSGQERKLRIFVKQGAKRRYDKLKRDATDLPVEVEWDRRLGERRSPAEAEGAEAVGLTARKGERRQAPSFTWDLADFVVVEGKDD